MHPDQGTEISEKRIIIFNDETEQIEKIINMSCCINRYELLYLACRMTIKRYTNSNDLRKILLIVWAWPSIGETLKGEQGTKEDLHE